MLSMILLHHKPHPTTLADLHNNATWLQWIIARCHIPVHLYPALLDQPLGFSVRFNQAALHHGLYQPDRESSLEFRDFLGCLTLAELELEIRFGSCRRLLTMQSFDQLARQRRFGVAWLHREYSLDLIDG